MEAASEVRVCHLMKVPFTAIKIVSDIEMECQESRELLFQEFLKNGVKVLTDKLVLFVEKIDEIANYQ